MPSRILFMTVLAAALSVSVCGQAQPDTSMHTSTPGSSLIGPGDVLEISVFDTPELESRVRVSDQGSIQMALIGGIQVAGLSPHEAADVIGKKLQATNTVKHPTVNVFVAEFAFNRVSILGEVKAPATFPVGGQTRLLDVVSEAGGLLPSASGIVTIAHRESPDQLETFVVSDPSQPVAQNPLIRPGDTIVAKKAGIVYVVGGVVHPGGFVLELNQKLSLLKAMALAQGPAQFASLGKSVLVRTVDGQRQEIPLDMKAVMHQRSPDLALQADDILYIPVNTTRARIHEGVNTIASAAAYAAIYKF